MKILPAAVVILCTIAISPTYAQEESCSEILKDGTIDKNVIERSAYYSTISAHETQSTSEQDVSAGGNGYNGKKNDRSALNQKAFDWLKNVSNIRYALMSGDSKIVDAWEKCMEKKGGGPIAWFEAPNANATYLKMQYIPAPNDSRAPISTTLKQRLQVPKGVRIEQDSGCQPPKGKIERGVCTIKLAGANPWQPLDILVPFQERASTIDLPPRIKVIKVLEPKRSYRFRKSVPPNGANDDNEIGITVDGSSYLEQKSEVLNITSQKGEAVGCRTKTGNLPIVVEESERHFSVRPFLGNNSKRDGAECYFEATYRTFHYEAQPIE